jgi:transposase
MEMAGKADRTKLTQFFLSPKIYGGMCSTAFVLNFPDKFSFDMRHTTFLVPDNARIHKTKAIRERIPYRQKRGLFLFFLPPYSPHLNIAETLWRKLKKEWLDPSDYLTEDDLAYALN